jgi:P27 family predicted phage terminase small subunit
MATRAPTGLGPRGKRLWKNVTKDLELDIDDAELLIECCRTLDNCEKLEEALRTEPLTTEGSRGQLVAHPLRAELRSERILAAKLLAQLGIPDEGDGNEWDGLTASQRGRKAVRARWDNRGGRR